MKFLLMFDGTLMVGFEPHEIDMQVDFLSNVEVETEEAQDIIDALLLKVKDNDQHEVN